MTAIYIQLPCFLKALASISQHVLYDTQYICVAGLYIRSRSKVELEGFFFIEICYDIYHPEHQLISLKLG